MPHQCVRCSKMYENTAEEIIKGCSCGARIFFFIRKEKFDKLKVEKPIEKLAPEAREQIEKDVREIIGQTESEDPVILDLESIRITGEGKYELDLVHLFNEDALVIKMDEGKYMIDLAQSFERLRKKIG